MDVQFFNKGLKGKLLFIQQASSHKDYSTQFCGQEEVGSKTNFDHPSVSRTFQQAMNAQNRMLYPSSQPLS